MKSAQESLKCAIESALSSEIPEILFFGQNGSERRRLIESEIRVDHFYQVWDSRKLGFDTSIQGCLTGAYTTVITTQGEVAYIYFDGKFAYEMDENCPILQKDIKDRKIKGVNDLWFYKVG